MKRVLVVVFLLPLLALVSACGGGGGEGGSGPVTVGASVSMTGPLAPIGTLLQKGYEQRAKEVNEAGGLDIGGSKREVDLKMLDNKSEPNLATEQARTLVTKEGAVALLGSESPPLNNPLAATAETLEIPLVMGLNPIRAFLSGTESEWHWAWDQFFDEEEVTTLQFKTADLTDTNKKVALFTDNEQDGVVMGGLWEKKAPEAGYDIVYHAKFPVGTTDYSSFIEKTKSSGAEIVIAQMTPPDGAALWKQFKALGYDPKLAFCEKCGTNGGWGEALGAVAEGTSGFSNWAPQKGLPETEQIEATLGKQIPNEYDLGLAVSGYTAAGILFDAIEAAGSTEPEAINDAIGETDKEYAVGHVKFTEHAYGIPAVMLQWQNGNGVQVYPEVEGTELQVPVKGLE